MTRNVFYRDYLLDYLFPVIELIKKDIKHTEAFKEIANKLQVTKQTVNDRCARGLGIRTAEFVSLVKSGRIKKHLLDKFPDRVNIINQNL
jgi:predicted DNA-binding protein YlxM (UPF0122 family)